MSEFASSGIERREFLRRTGAIGMTLSLPALLAACGGDDASGGGGGQRGGTLAVGSVDWLPRDFFVRNSLGAQLIGWTQMAWPLITPGSDGGSATEPGLAASYRASADGLEHTVTLHDGITFHDGSPIDADAVVANLKGAFFLRDPLHDGAITYTQVAITFGDPPIVRSVRAVDARTVTVALTEYRADIRNGLSLIPILNPRVLAQRGYGTNIALLRRAGSGPFRLTRFQAGDFAEYERYEDFFQPVLLDRVRLQRASDPGALALALRGGEIRVASGLSKADYDALLKAGFNAVVARPNVNVDFVIGPADDPAFRDRRVREAVSLAMNRAAYTERFFNSGTARVSTQPVVAPGLEGYVPDLPVAPYDPERARALMAEAGVTSARLRVTNPASQAPISSVRGLLEAIGQDLSAIGITLQIDLVDSDAAIDYTNDPPQAFLTSPGGGGDPFILFDLFYRSVYAPGALGDVPSIGRALDAAHATKDVAKRNELLQGIIRTTVDEALIAPICVVSYSALVADGVQDFPLTPTQIDSWNGVSVSG